MNPKELRFSRSHAQLRQGRNDWYRIDNKADGQAHLYIYDEIGYWGVTAQDLIKDMKDVGDKALTVHINSPGGEVYDGLAIYQALRSHGGDVTVIVDGVAASAASFIAMGGTKLVMAPKATMMIHDGLTMAIGNAAEMRKTAELLDKASDNIASIYADKSGQPTEFWRERMREETWYSADEAVEAGLADEVEGAVRTIDNSFDLSIFSYSGREAAPAPVIKPEAPAPELKGEPGPEVLDLGPGNTVTPKNEGSTKEPVVESKEPEPFKWDFAAFKSSLREGIRA